MRVYINMEMPKSCRNCPCFCEELFYCRAKEGDDIGLEKRPKDCPLVPVPPHGRLIDADELFKEMERKGWFDNADRDKAEDLVLDAPTIIPAEPFNDLSKPFKKEGE